MEKKNLALSIILPTLFGPLGLIYSSLAAGLILLGLNIAITIPLAITGNLQHLPFAFLFSQIISIFWSVLIFRHNKMKINEEKSSDFNITLGGQAFVNSLIAIFLSFLTTAIVCQFNEINILSSNLYAMYLVTLVFTLIISVIPERKNQND